MSSFSRFLGVAGLVLASLVSLSSGQSCSTAPTTSCPAASSLSSVPLPWFGLSFASNPSLLPAVGSQTTYQWLTTDDNADNCAAYHSGLVHFNGSLYGNSDTTMNGGGPWENLSTATGPTSVGSAIPGIIGGVGLGRLPPAPSAGRSS
jgi:hypothetical protein